MFAGINGFQHLWFVPADLSNPPAMPPTISGEGELLQKAYQAGTAFRCGQCKAVVLLHSDAGRSSAEQVAAADRGRS